MKLLITTVVAAVVLGACARAEDRALSRGCCDMSPEQRAQVLQHIYELRAAVAHSTEWDYRPLRTPQLNQQDFKPLTFCNTSGPYSYRTTVCD